MTSYSVIKVLNMIMEFLYTLATFCYNALFYQVKLFNNTFELWQVFGAVTVASLIIAIIIKIFI